LQSPKSGRGRRPGLPNIDVADLVYVPEKVVLYAATHGQGAWELKVRK